MIGLLFLIGSGICFKNFDSFVESNALVSGKTYTLSYDGTTWTTAEVAKAEETFTAGFGACQDKEGVCEATVESHDFVSTNTKCEANAFSEAAVTAALHDIYKDHELLKSFYDGKDVFSAAQLVGCGLEEKTNPVDDGKVKGEKCEAQTHILAAIQSSIEKPLALESCVAFKADGVYACDDKCTVEGKEYNTPVPSFIFSPKVGVMVGADAEAIKKHLSTYGPVFVPAVMDKDRTIVKGESYYEGDSVTDKTAGDQQIYCTKTIEDETNKVNIWIELIGYKTIKAKADSEDPKTICGGLTNEAAGSSFEVFQFRLPKEVATDGTNKKGFGYTLVKDETFTKEDPDPQTSNDEEVTYISLVSWREEGEEAAKKKVTDAYFVYYPVSVEQESGSYVLKYNAETKLTSTEKVDLETTEVYKKHHDDKKAAESFCIFETEDALYADEQIKNDYAAALAEGAWAENYGNSLLVLDVYYFASNLVKSLEGKKVSATGTFANIPNYGDGMGSGLLKPAKEEKNFVQLFVGYAYAAASVKIETTVAEAKELGDAKTEGVVGESLYFCSVEKSKVEEAVKAEELKKYIAWFGPVMATFLVDEDTLNKYMVKREKSAVMEYKEAPEPEPTERSSNGIKQLTVVLLGWQAEVKEAEEVKTPAHWIAKTLYPTQEAPKPEESNEADYDGRIIRIAIQNVEGKHVTDQSMAVQFALYSGEQPGPGPKPDDAAFGMVPSLFASLLAMLVALLF